MRNSVDLPGAPRGSSVAYVLKAFPRLSETFIASEIYRLERRGLALRLFIMKRPGEPIVHPTADAIAAPRVYLPEAGPVSEVALWRWLLAHASRFTGPLLRQARRHPGRTAKAAWHAISQAVKARKSAWGWPRKAPIKELLQAAALADAIHDAGDVRHIHAHFCHSAATVAWLASIMTALPMSFTAHAKDLYCPDLNPAGLLEKKLAAAEFVVTCTDAARAFLQSRTSTPVRCVYHGLDVEFSQLCTRPVAFRDHASAMRVLAVGRRVRKKGLDVLVEACALLRARGIAVTARIVGESGDHEPELRALVTARGLEHIVEFVPAMPRQQLFEEYMSADVFCLPCRVLDNGDRDGIPNVVAEAMACGVPVVTTEISGLPELLRDEVHGLLVPQDDPTAVAGAVARLQRDPLLRQRLIRQARARISDLFDGDVAIAALCGMLERGAA